MNEEREPNTKKNDEKLAINYTIADVFEAAINALEADEEE